MSIKASLPIPPGPRQNHLLAALPRPEYERQFPHLEMVPLPLGKALYESGDQLDHVYFPTTSIVSLLYELENGASAEIAVVGNDGVVGIALFMGGDTMPNRAVVQSAGHAYRLKGQLLKQEFNRAGALQHLLLRYTLAMLTDGADRRLQSAPFGGPATLPLAASQSRPVAIERAEDDPGADRQYAGGAARGCDRGCRKIAERRIDSPRPRPHHRAGSAGP